MDIGTTWYRGTPLSWTSARGERPAGSTDDDQGWHLGWAGGLVTTCGLLNAGEPSEGHGQHGRYTDQPAERVSIDSGHGAAGLSEDVIVRGEIRESDALGRGLLLRRTLRFSTVRPEIHVTDVTENESSQPVQAPILYHLNFGYPFLRPDSATDAEIRRSIQIEGEPRAFPRLMGEPNDEPDEVFEHDVEADRDGWASMTLTGWTVPWRVAVRWDTAQLPRAFTWRRRQRGSYVQAIEPANCSVLGRVADRSAGRAPILEPGESRTTRLAISVSEGI